MEEEKKKKETLAKVIGELGMCTEGLLTTGTLDWGELVHTSPERQANTTKIYNSGQGHSW